MPSTFAYFSIQGLKGLKKKKHGKRDKVKNRRILQYANS
jgi:hypothetical protein